MSGRLEVKGETKTERAKRTRQEERCVSFGLENREENGDKPAMTCRPRPFPSCEIKQERDQRESAIVLRLEPFSPDATRTLAPSMIPAVVNDSRQDQHLTANVSVQPEGPHIRTKIEHLCKTRGRKGRGEVSFGLFASSRGAQRRRGLTNPSSVHGHSSRDGSESRELIRGSLRMGSSELGHER